MRAVVLMSGGMDSAAVAYLMKNKGFDITALSVYYAQRHEKELEHAAMVARAVGAQEHRTLDLSAWGSMAASVLTREGSEIPEGHYTEDSMTLTVVPFRNAIFLSVAMSLAASIKANVVATAIHAGDHAIYPDCRPEFADSFQSMASYALEGLWIPKLATPFIHLSKAEIAAVGDELGVPWHLTWSCYKGGVQHCGRCGTCVERAEAFDLAGVDDPTEYQDAEYWKQAVQDYAGEPTVTQTPEGGRVDL